MFKENLAVMSPFDEARDGVGFEDRMTVRKRKEIPADCSEHDPSLLLENENSWLSAACKNVKEA
jgi:hypothetical protein